jgi:hypothetical protein
MTLDKKLLIISLAYVSTFHFLITKNCRIFLTKKYLKYFNFISFSPYQLMKWPTRFAKPELVELVAGVSVAVAAQLDVLQVVRAIAEHLTSEVCHVAVN